MNIPLTGEDCLIWKSYRKDKFPVKNAYNTICADTINRYTANDQVPRDVWEYLWKAKVPHRM